MKVSLRRFQPGDWVWLAEVESKPDMVQYQDFEARTPGTAQKYVEEAIHDTEEYVERVVCDLGTMQMIGRVGLRRDDQVGWLWYSIEPNWQGKGVATEAVRQLMANMAMPEYRIECHPQNLPSRSVARRLGMHLVIEEENSCVYSSWKTE